jgi:catalase
VIATHKGEVAGRRGDTVAVDRSFHTASSAEADAVIVAGRAGLAANPAVITYVQSAYRHHKPVGAWGDGTDLLIAAGAAVDEPGVVTSERATKTFVKAFTGAMAVHRHWDRGAVHPTRLAVQEA